MRVWLAVLVGCTSEETDPAASCPWEGSRTVDSVECDGVLMETFIAQPRPVTVFAAGHEGCEAHLDLQRLEEGYTLCEVSEVIALRYDGRRWTGESLGGSDSPDGCFGSAPSGLPLGTVGVETLPDGLVLSFDAAAPWVLSECAGTPVVRFGS